MMVFSGIGSHGSPSKAFPYFVQMSAGLLLRGSTSTNSFPSHSYTGRSQLSRPNKRSVSLVRHETLRSSCFLLLSLRSWLLPAPRVSSLCSCSIVLLNTFIRFGVICSVVAFCHDLFVAAEADQPESDAVAVARKGHVLPQKLALADWAFNLPHFLPPGVFQIVETVPDVLHDDLLFSYRRSDTQLRRRTFCFRVETGAR